jgi:hypothetical protein
MRLESDPRPFVSIFERGEAKAREYVVVHHGEVRRSALMLEVAGATVGDVGVESSWLPLKQA